MSSRLTEQWCAGRGQEEYELLHPETLEKIKDDARHEERQQPAEDEESK